MTERVTIGTDPELIFTDQNDKLLNASNYLDKEGKFGLDGHAWIAELRPDHAVYPRDLVESIRKTLGLQAEKLRDLIWLSGPWLKNKPMGGHLHFGIPFEDNYMQALDNQLGFLLALSEPEEGARTRRTQKFQGSHDDFPYGVLGNIRVKPAYGFEYRTPGSFLASPGIALATITVAKAIIMEEAEKASMAWSRLPLAMKTDLVVNKDDFNNANKIVFKNKLDSYWKMLKAMRYFQKGMEGHELWSSVAYLKSKVFPTDGFQIGHDIKTKWGFKAVNPLKIPKKKEPTPILLEPKFWGKEFRLIETKFTQFAPLPSAIPAQLWWEIIERIQM